MGECGVPARSMYRPPHPASLDGQEAVQMVSCSTSFTKYFHLRFIAHLVEQRSLNFLFNFLHSYLGFCTELSHPFSPGIAHTNRQTRPAAHHYHPKLAAELVSPMSYANNFGELPGGGGGAGVEGTRAGVQAHIVNTSLRRLVTRSVHIFAMVRMVTMFARLVKEASWLGRSENAGIASDTRAFLAFIQRHHGAAFRRVVLSGEYLLCGSNY